MNFASPYVFNNAAESESYEVVSDDEFVGGMEFSDSGSDDEYEDSAVREPLRRTLSDDQCTPTPPPPGSSDHKSASSEVSVNSCLRSDASSNSVFDRVRGFFGRGGSTKPASLATHSTCSASPSDGSHHRVCKPIRMHHWKSVDSADQARHSELKKKGKGRVFRRADTNVVSIRFDTLKTPSAMHAGEVIVCSDCEAIMSHISQMEDDGPDKAWKCEFCGNRNGVEIEEEEKPTADDVTYLVEPALSTSAAGTSGRDESIVIFCIDISGSMTITTEVPGHQELRGSGTLRRLRRENTMEGDQRLPSERRNVTYISRLQAVQAAVDHQLGEMAREFPHRRIGVVTFSYEVNVIGDGTEEEVVVSGHKLTDQDELQRIGSQLPSPKPVKETRAFLGEKIFKLEEGGSTALGPALIVALSMASQQPGSKVIVCTDGKSNEGVGKVENLSDSDPDPSEFYENVAQTAMDKGVSISVITIKGTDCKLIQLGKLADNTGGQVNIVDPLKLTEEFSNVLADRIIATNVVATFILHRGLYIGNEENKKSKEKRTIGNVRADHEISFEYGVRRKKVQEASKKPSPLHRISEVHTSMEECPATPSGNEDSTAGQSHPVTTTETQKEGTTTSTETEPEETTEGASANAGIRSGGCFPGSDGDGNGTSESIPDELPFQLQITYTDVNGMKALRVLTQKKPVTSDRGVAEKDADLNVLGVHTERKASELALQGDYTASRAVALTNHRLGWRCSRDERSSGDRSRRKTYHRAFSRVKTVENTITAKQMQEVHTYGRRHSDDEDEDTDQKLICDSAAMMPLNRASSDASHAVSKKWAKQKIRSEEIDDDMAEMMYQSRASSTAYTSKKSKK